jgi:hypothetical protein
MSSKSIAVVQDTSVLGMAGHATDSETLSCPSALTVTPNIKQAAVRNAPT